MEPLASHVSGAHHKQHTCCLSYGFATQCCCGHSCALAQHQNSKLAFLLIDCPRPFPALLGALVTRSGDAQLHQKANPSRWLMSQKHLH